MIYFPELDEAMRIAALGPWTRENARFWSVQKGRLKNRFTLRQQLKAEIASNSDRRNPFPRTSSWKN